jgi:hypothetical protein
MFLKSDQNFACIYQMLTQFKFKMNKARNTYDILSDLIHRILFFVVDMLIRCFVCFQGFKCYLKSSLFITWQNCE